VLLFCDISLYSVVKQRLKCNTGKVFDCLNQFLLALVLSIEERVFLVEYIFREGNRYTDLVQEQFAEKFPGTPVTHRNAVRRLIEKTGFRSVWTIVDITSITFYKCTATFQIHFRILKKNIHLFLQAIRMLRCREQITLGVRNLTRNITELGRMHSENHLP
jgi:hypothetical protein